MSNLTVVTNNHTRPLRRRDEIPVDVAQEWFDYVDENDFSARFFNYRGSWYDLHVFEVAPSSIKALGFDAEQAQSYFDCIAVRYFDREGYEYDDEVVVAHIHW